MHASIPITNAFLWFLCFPFLFSHFSSLLYLYFFSWWWYLFSRCPSTIYNYHPLYCLPWWDFPFLPLNRFWLLWVSFQDCHWPTDCPATTIALNVLVAPLLIPRQNGLSCFLFSSILTTLIWIKIEPLPHLPLWHASSGPLLFLLLLGEMSSQQDISPKEVSARTLK